MNIELLGQPLFEAAAQTLIGAMAGFAVEKVKEKFFSEQIYDGAFDFWNRGLHHHNINEGDQLIFNGLISPYIQLFPRDPYLNGKRWNQLYSHKGQMSAAKFANLEFYNYGSDHALRTGSLNGETLVGLYYRYGYIGEGVLGVISTSNLLKMIPEFISPNFFGVPVRAYGTLSYCPSQHSHIAHSMFQKLNKSLSLDEYMKLPYIKINKIKLYNKSKDRICSLLGSPWAATTDKDNPYLIQYGYFSEDSEVKQCLQNIATAPGHDKIQVFYDKLRSPSPSLSFTHQFLT